MFNSNIAINITPDDYRQAHCALSAWAVVSSSQQEALKTSAKALEGLLEKFEPHSLPTQNQAALMDRVDTKFVLPVSFLIEILAPLTDSYSILSAADRRLFNYETTYFDTIDRAFYHAHHNGKLNRHKVRYRRYRESDLSFMEVKLRTNKQRTIKSRVSLSQTTPESININQFVAQCLQGNYPSLEPTLFVNYRRLTLMNQSKTERLTIDLDLSFQAVDSQKTAKLPALFVAEVKRGRDQQPSIAMQRFKSLGITPTSFSKYCMGCTLTGDGSLKSNRFKPVLQKLKKLAPDFSPRGQHA